MNVAAAIAYTTVMLLGLGGITTQFVWAWRNRQPPPLIVDVENILTFKPLMLPSIYYQTVHTIGDPTHIDTTLPAFAWPA